MTEQIEKKMIRLSYCEGETGWAEDLGDGRVKIANCPLIADLRVGDICSTYEDGEYEGWLKVGEILEREYPHTACIRYPEDKYWYLIRGATLAMDWRSEGGIAAKDGKPGFCMVNYKGEEDALPNLLKKLHIDDKVEILTEEEETDD
jgi:hypothetical protein